jgi:hypothetical protein
MAKKKKEKIIYYDDNSTLVDMSNVTRNGKKQTPRPPKRQSTFREKWTTYWSAVKMMVIPMCIALLIIAVLYFVVMFAAGNF